MSDRVDIQLTYQQRGRSITATIQFPDSTSFTDEIDVTKFRKREEFIENACADREVPKQELRRKLEEIAAALAGAGEPAADGSGGSNQNPDADQDDDGSVAATLVSMAQKEYRLGRTQQNEAFAVPIEGSRIVRGLNDSGGTSLRAEIAKRLWERDRRVANGSALTDALQILVGIAMDAEPEEVSLRVARHGEDIVLDLGDEQGHVVLITKKGWAVTTDSPVLFRRTQLTGCLPVPLPGGSLDELLNMINVSDESKPLVIGYLVSALFPEIKHPIVLMGGLKGAGKSTGAEAIARVLDPGPAMLRTPPREVEEWALNASSSWIVVIDNVSRISEWWSDALCRAATGDGLVRRRLFTSEQLSVLSFLRVVMLTSIDAGALKGDFGDRVLLIDLRPIPKRNRRSETGFWSKYREAHPRILGALLDLMVRVLEVLPGVNPAELERMADFYRVLLAVDQVRGTNGADIYVRQRTRVAEEVVEGDPVAQAVIQFVQQERKWTGTSKELLGRLTPERAPKGWPESPRALSGCLRRLVPVLMELGVEVVPPADANRGRTKERDRLYELRLLQGVGEATVHTVQPSANGPGVATEADSGWTVAPDTSAARPSNVAPGEFSSPDFGRLDGLDGRFGSPSADVVEQGQLEPWPTEISPPLVLARR